MRRVALAAVLLVLCQPVLGAVTSEIDPRASLSVVQQWIYNYRAKPDYAHVPAAVRVLFHSQTFKEPETAGIYLGFIAGAIGSNPAKAEQLVNSFFPVPPEDEWVVIRAIAYSGLSDWRNLLRRVAPKMPARRVMIDAYLAGTLPTLTSIAFGSSRSQIRKCGTWPGMAASIEPDWPQDMPVDNHALPPSPWLDAAPPSTAPDPPKQEHETPAAS